MRKEIPVLSNDLTKEKFFSLIVDSFQSVVFGTVDENGNPFTNVQILS